MTTWAVVPIRGLAAGKTRLAAVLDPPARARLNAWLLDRTLDAVEAAIGDPARCVVASAGADALAQAKRRGAEPLADRGDGLDAALDTARRHVLARGATRLLIVAADLPALDARALEAALAATPVHQAALFADRAGTGTNGMVLPAAAGVRFAYGPDSLRAHREACARAGVVARVLRHPALAFDLDTPADWRSWRAGRAVPLP